MQVYICRLKSLVNSTTQLNELASVKTTWDKKTWQLIIVNVSLLFYFEYLALGFELCDLISRKILSLDINLSLL